MKGLLPLLFMVIVHPVRGQLLTQYTQYLFNHFSVNPAVAGSNDCLDMRLGFRTQWVGFEGAPTTGWVSVHGTLGGKKRNYNGNKHGIGAFIEADNAGNWGYTRLLLAYAYNIRTSQNSHLAFGLFAGGQQMKLSTGDITLSDYDDPVVSSASTVMLIPEITPGLWYYNKHSWYGLSIHQVLANDLADVGVSGRLSRHVMLSGGRRFKMGQKSALVPSALLKFSGASPWALDLNLMAEWDRVLALGLGYRNGDAVTMMLRVGFLEYFQLGYSYDVTTSKLRAAGSNTHEVVLAITPCSRTDMRDRMISCPAFE